MINLTENAVTEVKRIRVADPANSNAHLRVQVIGGGCSGMSYKLEFESTPTGQSDCIFEKDGVQLVVDKKITYLFNRHRA